MVVVNMGCDMQRLVWRHLLPRRQVFEQAGFLFAVVSGDGDDAVLTCKQFVPLTGPDFSYQSSYHIEVGSEALERAIKCGHDTGMAIVEIHSHLGQWPAKFSGSDYCGFREWVPHVRWRLKGRPYGALVVTNTGYDGLFWQADEPGRIHELRVGRRRVLIPTALSPLSMWGNKDIEYE